MTNSACGRLDQHYCHTPVILIICPPGAEIHLDELCSFKKRPGHQKTMEKPGRQAQSREIVADGMTFRLTVENTHDRGNDREINNLFTSSVPHHRQAVGIALGQHLAGGKHMMPVNLMLLSIARAIGQKLGATGIIWWPARLHVDFAHFSEAVDHYAESAIFPTFVQIALLEPGNGRVETRGLEYFTGTEIRILFPAQQNSRAWMTRFLKIIGAVMSGGKLTDQSPVLLDAPHDARLAGCHRDGAMFEISYSESIPVGITKSAGQAALGAASLTF